jgi:hypothetical protein
MCVPPLGCVLLLRICCVPAMRASCVSDALLHCCSTAAAAAAADSYIPYE